MLKKDWENIQDWMNDHKDLMIMVADPETDSICISFGKQNAFVKFPMDRKENGVIFNALRKSKFNEAIDPLMVGLIDATGIKETTPEGNQLYQVIGGTIKSFGEARDRSTQEIIKKNQNAKSKKS